MRVKALSVALRALYAGHLLQVFHMRPGTWGRTSHTPSHTLSHTQHHTNGHTDSHTPRDTVGNPGTPTGRSTRGHLSDR